MKKITKKLVAFLLAMVMTIPSFPTNVIKANAEETEVITLDFGRPTTGVISSISSDNVSESIGITGEKLSSNNRTYTITTAMQGNNWRLNPSRTTAALNTEVPTRYKTDTAGMRIYVYHANGNDGITNAETGLDGRRTEFFIFGGKTIAFDFDIASEQAGQYAVELVFYATSTPRKLTMKFNEGSTNAAELAFTGASNTNTDVKQRLVDANTQEAKTITLQAGTNTLDIINPATNAANETRIRAIVLTKVGEIQAPTAEPTMEPTAEPTMEPTAEPTLAPTAKPTNRPGMEPFYVSMKTTDISTTYKDGSNYYFKPETVGSNWAIHSSTKANTLMAEGSTDTSSVTRIFVTNGVATRATLYRKNTDFVISFTAPEAGYYDLSCDVHQHRNGGYADIYINGVKVGTLDGNANSGVNRQTLSNVYIKEGELANTLKIKATGVSTGGAHYFDWTQFVFAPTGYIWPTPTPAPTPIPTATPKPTEDPNAVKEPFKIDIATAKVSTMYKDSDSLYYMTKETKGDNWAVHSSTSSYNLVSNPEDLTNKTRVYIVNGVPHRAYMMTLKRDLVLSFTAPASGYYEISSDVYWHQNAGYGDIFINGEYVGTLDGNKASGTNVQQVFGAYLYGGELENTIKIRTTGVSTGGYHYLLWRAFNFTPSDVVTKCTGMEISVPSDSMYVGDTQNVDGIANTTNGSLYRFNSSSSTVTYTSSDTTVATVSKTGEVKALKAGKTTITATISSLGYTDSAEIEVVGIEYETPEINLPDGQKLVEGDDYKLKTKAKLNNGKYASADKVTTTYESSDDSIAKVEDGVLYTLKPGNAKITAHITYEGKTLDIVRNIIVTEYAQPVPFDVAIKNAKDVVVSDSNYYIGANTVGANWVVSPKTTASLATDKNNVGRCRVFRGDYYTYLTIMHLNKNFVFDVNVEVAGKYDITANVIKHRSGGYAAVYVNDVYVGTINCWSKTSNLSKINEQPLLGVKLLEGSNTITVKPLGSAGGADTSYYAVFAGFSFTTPEQIAKVTEIKAIADVDNMYIGRDEKIHVEAILSNGGFYEFSRSTETFTYVSSNPDVASVSSSGVITGLAAGETTVTVTANDGGWSDSITFTVSDAPYEKVEMNIIEGANFYVSSEQELEVVATLRDGTVISQNDLEINYTSSNESVVKIEDGVLKAVAKGNATITAKATFTVDGTIKTDVKNITVTTIPLKTVIGVTPKVVQELDKDGVQLTIQGIAEDDTIVEDLVAAGFTTFDYTYTSLNPELLTIDENGVCRYVSRGVARVQINAVIDGVTFENVVEVVSSSGKRGRTIYTDEMVENARYNVKNYKWGQKAVSSLGGKAYRYVYSLDKAYDLITSEGVPRSYQVATKVAQNDVLYNCPACGINVDEIYGDWKCNPWDEVWKIWCPHCKSKFPTNDFALLYERGLDENGEYNRDLAVQRNAEAVARGEKDALVNELYPERGATWMVDDGYGWSPTSGTYGTKDMVQHAAAAKYAYMVWLSADHTILDILDNICKYYLYTGDEEFGQAGAILLDRVADVYPGFDITRYSLNYHTSHGGGYNGKINGNIGEETIAEIFIQCYDAFYDRFDDPEVVEYASKKAIEKGLDNPKTNGNLIRENVENGILREVIDSIYTAKIYGNFGYHQGTSARVAVALDTQPETDDMLRWLKQQGSVSTTSVVDPVFGKTYTVRNKNTGGQMGIKYANEIDRDGFGAEVSVSYNQVWMNSIGIAEILKNYGTDILDLYDDPKFVNMLDSFIHMTAGDGYTLHFGDGGDASSGKLQTNFVDDAISFYKFTKDVTAAQLIYFYNGGDFNNSKLGYFNNTKELTLEIQNIIKEYGEYKLGSENLTGYGLAILRGGKAATKSVQFETRYDTWMYYGRTSGAHAHLDMLALGIDAYGFNFMPDLGQPAFKGENSNRMEWINNTLAHNTVVVNEQQQDQRYTGTPLHFDSTDNVKLMDVESKDSYENMDVYRRTAVTIAANEDVSYTLDFFRVKGGDTHTYSFHTQSYKHFFTDDLELVPQVNEKGEYIGTYAGADVPYGPDPNSTDNQYSSSPMYPRGYTWLDNVNRGTDKTGDGVFTVKFEQTDFKHQVVDSGGLAIKVHAVNDWTPDSVDIMVGYPSPKKSNLVIPGYDYMLIQRRGEDLDTLFTTLFEPFKVNDYIQKVEPIAATLVSGTEGQHDIVKAVKVTLKNGRTDYVVYATNSDVIYNVTDGNVNFDFAGFVGVYSVDFFGNNIFSYVNDGTIIGNVTSTGAYTGTVVDFTKDYVIDDYIIIKTDQPVEDPSVFNNQYIYINNSAKCNGVYRIISAEKQGENISLYLGNCSLVDAYKNSNNPDEGYIYSIADGQTFTIPVSAMAGDAFKGTQRPAGTSPSTPSDDETSTDVEATEVDADMKAIEDEMLYGDLYGLENGKDAPEDLADSTKDPEVVISGQETPAPSGTEPSSTPDVNAGGNQVRNILLGGLGVLALIAGIFLILLGKKKDEEEKN